MQQKEGICNHPVGKAEGFTQLSGSPALSHIGQTLLSPPQVSYLLERETKDIVFLFLVCMYICTCVFVMPGIFTACNAAMVEF